ncbi:protein 1 isoform X1 [Capsicum galapagoense]
MGNQCTKPNNRSTGRSPSPSNPESSSNSDVSPDLSSYQTACEEDPELQRFDSALQARASLALNSIAVNTDYRSLSLESLREVTLCFLDMNQGVVNFILESKKDIWKDPDIFDLVKDYLDNSIHIMNFCTSLDDCLERAHDSQSIILVALTKFENETNGNEGDSKLLFTDTLEQLKSFTAAGDPFTAKFFSSFHSVYLQQEALLTKLKSKKNKLDKKLSRVKTWKRVSNIIFATVFVSAIICSIVAAAVTAPPIVTALAAAASVPLGTVGKWINSMWNKYEDELKREREILTSMQAGSFVVIQDLEHIRVLADKLQIIFEGLLHNADFAIRGTDAVTSAMEEVKKNVNGFSETIEVLSQHAKKCNQDIRMARAVILRKIVSQPSSSNQGFDGIDSIKEGMLHHQGM